MDSLTGKRLLALVRDGDYAHPGETAAVDSLMAGLPGDRGRAVLDAGCGRGGTAEYVRRRGLGTVTGIERDPALVREARELYPQVRFVPGDIAAAPSLFAGGTFDLVYTMTVLYSIDDQRAALTGLRSVARPDAGLRLLEYSDPFGDFLHWRSPDDGGPAWRPLRPAGVPELMTSAGWAVEERRDLSPEFELWYDDLCRRIADREREIVERFGREWYDFVVADYEGILGRVRRRELGGILVVARAV